MLIARADNIAARQKPGRTYARSTMARQYLVILKPATAKLQKQKTVFLQGASGVQHSQAKKYRLLNDRVLRALASYGKAEALTYVRAIAHLLYI